jgi:hypothetical protein
MDKIFYQLTITRHPDSKENSYLNFSIGLNCLSEYVSGCPSTCRDRYHKSRLSRQAIANLPKKKAMLSYSISYS